MKRIEWMRIAAEKILQRFDFIKVSINSIEFATGTVKSAKGTCEFRGDGRFIIYLSDSINSSQDALEVILHELCHAHCFAKKGGRHRGHDIFFEQVARRAGLTGQLKSTAASFGLQHRFNKIITEIGSIPNAL